jgi:acyl-CoA synthetase (AMP-forming)/AMP-acid ligase II
MQLPERLELIESVPLTKVGKRDKMALKEDISRKLGLEQVRLAAGFLRKHGERKM